jgi:hypothetical protein
MPNDNRQRPALLPPFFPQIDQIIITHGQPLFFQGVPHHLARSSASQPVP